jgi:hypothetical protein
MDIDELFELERRRQLEMLRRKQSRHLPWPIELVLAVLMGILVTIVLSGGRFLLGW